MLRLASHPRGRVATLTTPRRSWVNGFHSARDSQFAAGKRRLRYATAAVISGASCLWLVTSYSRTRVLHLDSQLTEHLDFGSGPSRDDVSRILSHDAFSHLLSNSTGVNRYDGTRVASNSPCEDRFLHGSVPLPLDGGKPWMAWAVFDGHAGWQTADLLQKQLLPFIQLSFGQIRSSLTDATYTPDVEVQNAITRAFLKLDNAIMKPALTLSQGEEALSDRMMKLAPAVAGSCALLSLYNPSTRKLYVACTGDSRAVLGRKRPDGTWDAIPLSIDQTGRNAEEVTRLQNEHPGEQVVQDGRVLGLAVSRAFGDGRWKWPIDLQHDLKRRFYSLPPLTPKYDVRTPPYLTAEPVITTTFVDPDTPSFLIMATDGMWDMLSSQQAVDLVGKWLGAREGQEINVTPEIVQKPFDFGQFWKGVDWRFIEARTTVQDENAAVHLARNCLGGNNHELISGRLAASAPFSRRIRDDITIQVAFFNQPGLGKKN